MLSAVNLVRRYGDLVAVSDVSFDVSKGSCFGLLGPNGAGKTSTIGMLAGLVHPGSGNVSINGKPVTPNSFASKRLIGYVPQEIALYEELTARDNLVFFGGLYGLDSSRLATRIEFALELSGLSDRSKEPIKRFSGGMKRRLNIAAALLAEPELLILDEPTVGVDPQSRNAIFEVLQALQGEGMTLVYTTHYMEEVEKLCDHVAIMDGGKIVANDTLNGLLLLVAAKSTLEVRTGSRDHAVALELGLCQMGIEASTSGQAVHVAAADLSVAMGAACKVAAEKSVAVLGVQSGRVTLEQVFLHLTGKSLRD